MSILHKLLLSITVAISVILLGTLALNLNAARDRLIRRVGGIKLSRLSTV